MKSARPALLDRMLAVLMACAFFGYPLVASLAILLELDSRATSLPYRALVFGLTLVVLVLAAVAGRRSGMPASVRLLLGACVAILTLRFLNDAVALGLPPHPVQDSAEYATFFYGVTLFPALALAVQMQPGFRSTAFRMLTFFGTTSVAVAVLAITFATAEIDVTGRAESEGLNAISFATIGAFLVLLVWSRPAAPKRRWREMTLRVGAVLLGLLPLVAAASRGPIICVLLVLAADQVIRSKAAARWKSILGMTAAAAVLMLAGMVWVDSIDDGEGGLAIARRVADASSDQSTTERLVILASSWDVFMQNPLLGGAMVEPILKAYPHNVLLEALMVGGLLFGFCVLGLLVAALVQAIRLMASDPDEPLLRFVGMVALFTLGMSMLSGSLYRGPELWAAIALCFSFRAPGPTSRRRRAGSAALVLPAGPIPDRRTAPTPQ